VAKHIYRIRRWLLLTLVIALLAACGDNGQQTRTQVAAISGEIPPPPLSPRDAPASVLIGNYVIVFGGTKDQGDKRVVEGDGALFDRATGKWAAMTQPPFKEPLFQPALVAADDRLIVVGAPCREVSVTEGEGEAVCTTDTALVGASYDPGANEWTALPASSVLKGASGRIGASAVGWAKPRAVFRASLQGDSGLLAYDTTNKDWKQIPTVAGVSDPYCAVRDAIVAIGQPETSTRPAGEYDGDVATYALSGDTWNQVADAPAAQSDQRTSTAVCGTAAVVDVPWLTDGVAGPTAWFSSEEGWQSAPMLSVPVGSRVSVALLGDGTRALGFSDGSRLEVFTQAPGATEWHPADTPDFSDATFSGGAEMTPRVVVEK
jgi:hypothetical protein